MWQEQDRWLEELLGPSSGDRQLEQQVDIIVQGTQLAQPAPGAAGWGCTVQGTRSGSNNNPKFVVDWMRSNELSAADGGSCTGSKDSRSL